MKNLGILGGMLGAALVTVVACSSSSSSGPGGASSSCIASLESSGSTNSACASCMNSNCGDQITAASNSCSNYFSCVCPNGTYSASAVSSQTCVADLQNQQGCAGAFENVGSCQTQKCASQCSDTTGGTDSGVGSSSGGSDSGTSATLSAACQSFETCCEAFLAANPTYIPAGQTAHSACEYDAQNASFGGDAACNQIKATYAADGGGPSSCQ